MAIGGRISAVPLASAKMFNEHRAAMAPGRSYATDGVPLKGDVCDSRLGLRSKAATNKKSPTSLDVEDFVKFVAATYSPTWWGSTIGDGELNFSVRNGKRWILTAITATIYVLRKNNSVVTSLSSHSLSQIALFLA